MKHEEYLQKAFEAAFEGIRNNVGGPFGALIVKDNKILSVASNEVTSANDPTAHAEITAIRKACQKLNHFDLSGAVLYTTCEPCPMCLAAIYWARIGIVYYCSSRKDAERIGFDDNHIHQELGISLTKSSMKLIHIPMLLGEKLFEEWFSREDKIEY